MSIAVLRPRFTDHPRAMRGSNSPAADRSDVGDQVDHDQRRRERRELHAEARVEKLRKPEQIEEPDRIGERLSDDERPRLPAEQGPPGHPLDRLRGSLRMCASSSAVTRGWAVGSR